MGKDREISGKSINFKINAANFARMFFAFFLLDIIMLIFDLIPCFSSNEANLLSCLSERYYELINSAKYIVIAVIEGVFLIIGFISGTISVKKKLAPMEAVSKMAMKLGSHDGDFNEEKLHALEAAIDSIQSVDGSNALNSGDKELEGLELAVNGLINRMRESYKQQTRFVSDASHELRTPIAVIKGYADMLDRWGKTDESILNESVEAIRVESDHMSYLVDQLLFLARGDSGKTKLQIKEFDLFDMMHEVYEESGMIDKNHEYEFKAEESIKISGDESMLKQTARILVENASKYTPEGGKIIIGAEKNDKGVCFYIQDNGIGMNKEELPYMFDRFYRADNSRGSTSGTGLGLSIAKWIVDRHGGYFSVVSREGLGTKICVFVR